MKSDITLQGKNINKERGFKMKVKELKEYKKELEEYMEMIDNNMNILDKEVHQLKVDTKREINRIKKLIKSEIVKELI